MGIIRICLTNSSTRRKQLNYKRFLIFSFSSDLFSNNSKSPSLIRETFPVSSEITMQIASVRSVIPMAALWRRPNLLGSDFSENFCEHLVNCELVSVWYNCVVFEASAESN